MDLRLTDKKVLITGSTSGIGFEIAKRFLEEGASVTINGRSDDNLQNALDRLKESFPDSSVNGIVADFRNPKAHESVIKLLPEVDILINNVGIYASKTFDETSDQDWEEMFQVNVMAAIRLSRHYLPQMKKTGWGRILFVSSECAQLVPEDLIAYSTTKAALLALSRGLAQTTKGTEVTVNAIIPGSTLTEGAKIFLQQQAEKENKSPGKISEEFFQEARPSSLLQRFAEPKEVADMALFLSSPLSAATNGAAIKVDGGSIPGIF
ncbi:SDR family NAD(P)-dependent oxidoreductase [Lutimonas zeaxanthinifaciens]|uniref:SDR family NAD(P)-dependent oxidoreductase n=1 Tax=Lutimonas zeaxanthinifaciens TaxID=3060215 RepID=UPI00265CFF48|nr:SDR family oxidoreductase [Lutimonas sp. YSD2104]WKK66328.1 SDR family oxidoreductase [Lutimonas sp. YSD2104]